MEIDPAEPRARRDDALLALEREDLDLLAVDELEERVARMTAEIDRARRAADKKRAGRGAADALFSFGKQE